MTEEELQSIVKLFISKGYCDGSQLRDSDDLYDATDEDRDRACEILEERLSKALN